MPESTPTEHIDIYCMFLSTEQLESWKRHLFVVLHQLMPQVWGTTGCIWLQRNALVINRLYQLSMTCRDTSRVTCARGMFIDSVTKSWELPQPGCLLSKESLAEAINVEKTAQEDANIHTRVRLNTSENGAPRPKNNPVQSRLSISLLFRHRPRIWVWAGMRQNYPPSEWCYTQNDQPAFLGSKLQVPQ